MQTIDFKQIHELLTQSGVDASNVDAVARYIRDEQAIVKAEREAKTAPRYDTSLRKDTVPSRNANATYLYQNGPFSLIEGDVFSEVVSSEAPLLSWLPTRMITDRFALSQHLEYVAPEGFDGSKTYAEWLATIDIDECGYGPSTTWNGFSYQQTGGSFSWSTGTMKRLEDGGMKYYENSPIYTVRGNNQGMPLSSDREWAVARLFMALNQHLDYVVAYGDDTNSVMEWNGLDTILRPGYIQARKVGSGSVHWADPLIINAIAVNSPAAILQNIRALIRRIRNRLRQRGLALGAGDMVVRMPAAMWDNLAEHIAQGVMYNFSNSYNLQGTMDSFLAAYNRVRTGGIGYGTIEIDGIPVPVMAEPDMGINSVIDPSGTALSAVTGDIQVLTRRAGGLTFLEQQYVDWRKLDWINNSPEEYVNLKQGHVRAGWVTEANKCYYYYAEMAGRVVSNGQPYQGVIRNVTLATLLSKELEGGSFYSPDFWVYNGLQGGTGVARL